MINKFNLQKRSGAVNSLLTTTRTRSYVVRGSDLGVFNFTSRGTTRFETMLSGLKFNKQSIRPDKIMLHDGEKRMIIRDEKDSSKLYNLDLGSEKIVEEWKLGEDYRQVNLRDMAPTAKNTEARAGLDPTFMGITDNSVFRVDTRLKNGVVGDWHNGAYTYSKSMGLSAISTTADAGIAVASVKGELRLYNDPTKRAKTTLQATGEPIQHLDVSASGQYVLATCASHLLLFDVSIDGSKNGFQKSMPSTNRPNAIRLQIMPEHIAQMNANSGSLCFNSAYFNISPEGETNIVTAVGPYVVTWKLQDALEHQRNHRYTIKRYSDHVVADQFRFGDDKKIILALPNDVKSVSRSTLKKADRAF